MAGGGIDTTGRQDARRTFGALLAGRRHHRAMTQDRLAAELCARSGHPVLTRHEISRWERGARLPSRFWLAHLAASLGLPLPELESMAYRCAAGGEAAMRRRDALTDLGGWALAAAIPAAALDAATGYGRATRPFGRDVLDLVETQVYELNAAWRASTAEALFPIARAARYGVEALLSGPHTLAQRRELFVLTGWHSELLAWIALDLGHATLATGYAADAVERAGQAGHPELCAWALDAQVSINLQEGHLGPALEAARRGFAVAPAGHPMRVRLAAQTARVLARQGRAREHDAAFRVAVAARDRLPASAPTRIGLSTDCLADHAITAYRAVSALDLGRAAQAREHAEGALRLCLDAAPSDYSPRRTDVARLTLARAYLASGARAVEACAVAAPALGAAGRATSVGAAAASFVRELGRRDPASAAELSRSLGEPVMS